MKIYILCCVNEESELVLAKPFKEEDMAHKTMTDYLLAEYEDRKRMWPDTYEEINKRSGAVGGESWCYLYTIVEEELI